MTQQMDPRNAPTHDRTIPTQQPWTTEGPTGGTTGWPTPGVPIQGYPPPTAPVESGFGPPPAPPYGPPAGPWDPWGPPHRPYGPPPAGVPGAGPHGGGARTGILVGAVVVVLALLGGVLAWTLLSAVPTASAPVVPAPSAAPVAPAVPSAPVAVPAAPAAPGAPDAPAAPAVALQQLADAVTRYNQAGQEFQQGAKGRDRATVRDAVTAFRAATVQYDSDIRAIRFPDAQQTVVNTQLLPATGRLVADLDELAQLDPVTADAAGDRVGTDVTTAMTVTQQLASALGGS